jgi:hypothetical protein
LDLCYTLKVELAGFADKLGVKEARS